MLTFLALPIPVLPWLVVPWLILVCLSAGVAGFDAFLTLRRRPAVTVARTVPGSLPVSAPSSVRLTIRSRESRTLSLAVHDFYPPGFSAKDLPAVVSLPAGHFAEIRYEIVPSHRGRFVFSGMDMVVRSPLGCWRKRWFFSCTDTVRVFPDFRGISRFSLLAVSHDLGRMGIRKIHRRGDGGEFHQLREYREGDGIRNIDWKATSRYRRLISREYQDERDQQIVFMLDCGRRMRHLEDGKSLLDQALAAVLLLAHVASKQGDSTGIYAFGGGQRWVPPLKRSDSVRQLLLQTFDLHATTTAADYLAAAAKVTALQQRRSLVILLTSSRAEDQGDVLHSAILLARRHLVVVADLRESVLDEVQQQPIGTFGQALRYQALKDYRNQRTALGRIFTHHGILSLDVTAGELPATLVNRYLEIKSSGSL